MNPPAIVQTHTQILQEHSITSRLFVRHGLRLHRCIALLVALFCFIVRPALATDPLSPSAEIVQDGYYIYDQINYYSPIGQTFTPTVTSPVSVDFNYADFNPTRGPNSLTVDLYSGAGTSGPLLASTVIDLPTGFNGFYAADFPSVDLVAGSVYTAIAVDPTVRWGIATDNEDAYAGGEAIIGGLQPGEDLTFEVDAIPEPSTAWLLVLGTAILIISLGRKHRVTVG